MTAGPRNRQEASLEVDVQPIRTPYLAPPLRRWQFDVKSTGSHHAPLCQGQPRATRGDVPFGAAAVRAPRRLRSSPRPLPRRARRRGVEDRSRGRIEGPGRASPRSAVLGGGASSPGETRKRRSRGRGLPHKRLAFAERSSRRRGGRSRRNTKAPSSAQRVDVLCVEAQPKRYPFERVFRGRREGRSRGQRCVTSRLVVLAFR